MIELIIGGIVLLIIFISIFNFYHNKFKFSIIKIDEAESNIELLFEKKVNLLERTRPIIKKELKKEEFLEDISDFSDKKLNHFEINDILKAAYNELFKTIDDNEKLLKSESLISIIDELNDNEENIIGSIKFYNDTVVGFNQLVVSFPAKVVALFCRYKKKDFYNNEKREIYEILNDK